MTVSIRRARAGDVLALAELRMANGERHAGLDPAGHRVPEPEPVRRYFEELLGVPPDGLIAPILAPNTQAVDFHARAGFGSHGVILLKDLATEGGEDR